MKVNVTRLCLCRLLRDHERWRRNLEELLDEKDKRMDEIQLQKEKSIMEVCDIFIFLSFKIFFKA